MNLTKPLFIEVGRRRYAVADFRQASEMFCAARDAGGFASSEMPDAWIVTESGERAARISYNGRVWPPTEWVPGMLPLYDNR